LSVPSWQLIPQYRRNPTPNTVIVFGHGGSVQLFVLLLLAHRTRPLTGDAPDPRARANPNKDQPNDDNSWRARADISLHPSPIFGSVSFLVWMDRLPPIQELIFNKWIRGMPFIDSRNVRIGKAFESFFLGGAVSNQKNRWWKNRTKSSGHPNLASV
jgi:hypothetical protein